MRHTRTVAGSLAVILLLLGQASCVVRSAHPWFPSRDVVFEQDLLGGWVGTDGGRDVAMTFVRDKGNAYFMQYQSGDVRGSFRALLGKVSGEYYLDYRPIENPPGIDGMMFFPTHAVARLEIGAEKLVVRAVDYDVLKVRAQAEKLRGITFAWDEANELLITSKSDELRTFLVNNSRDEDLYAPPLTLTRRK